MFRENPNDAANKMFYGLQRSDDIIPQFFLLRSLKKTLFSNYEDNVDDFIAFLHSTEITSIFALGTGPNF
jgi:hypothetical protein